MRKFSLLALILLSFNSCGLGSGIEYRLANDSYRCEQLRVSKERMLSLLNNARAERRSCGRRLFAPAGRVTWSPALASAALSHSKEMANENFVSHTGKSGKEVSDRVERAGYDWAYVGENISAGREDSAEVVSAWLDSPLHCENIMNPAFTEIGAACVYNKDTRYKTFWTVVFASPKK